MRLRQPAGSFLAVAAILWMAMLFPGGVALADHSGGLDCYSCHAFSAGTVEPGTTSMAKSAMTEIKTHGWSAGQRLSCTFCHRSVNSIGIPDVLSDFTTTGVSRHPVSRNFVSGAVDNTAYLSNDNTAFAQHLDCRDCHDIALTAYPNHDNGWLNSTYSGGGSAQRNKTTNPFGLKLVSAPKAYDDLCRNCHQSLAAFLALTGKNGTGALKLVLAAHDNGADNTTNAIKDIDNTQLRTQVEWNNKRQCNICHDAHFSANGHLFSDGHERKWDNTFKTAISETIDCTNVCHYRGDAQGGYDTHGHGKATNWSGVALNRNCTFCHDASKPHLPSSTDYSTKYRFPTLDNSWLTQSVFQKPVRSVCATCHPAGSYPLHQTSKGNVGCIDCHDQHAKSSDNNVMMIRNTNRVAGSILGISGVGSTIGSEPILFAKSQKYPAGDNVYHYYTNVSYQGDTSAGLCDQRACHGAGVASDNATPLVPLSGLMVNSKHSGDNQATSTNCETCHKHTDGGGSFRAVSSCTTCHGQPPPPADNTAGPAYFYNESFTPHPLHAGTTGYQINCRICHVRYTDGATHYTFPTLGVKTFQSVFFDGSVARGTSAYDNSTLTCTNIYCHSDGRGGNPNVAPQWMTPGNPTGQINLTCAGCHNSDGVHYAQRMSSGAHTTHLNNGHTCSACHVNTVSDDNVTLNPSTGLANHVNFADNLKVNVTIRSSYDNDANPVNNWDNATKTCSGVSCHGGNPVRWTDIGLVTCASCHLGAGDVDDFGTGTAASMKNGVTGRIDNNEWTWSGHGATSATHPGGLYEKSNHPVAAFGGTNPCLYCHDNTVSHDNAVNIFRLKVQTGVAGYSTDSWNATCLICHSESSPVPPGYNYPGGPGVKNSLDNGTRVDSAHFGAKHGGANDNGGAFCFDCHDPHGDRNSSLVGNVFMIGKRVSRSTDNVLGIPVGGNDNTRRPTTTFTDNTTGANYADNTTRQGICQVCHTTGSVNHWTNSAPWSDGHNAAAKCTTCHSHNDNFKGAGGSNVEQFFDKPVRAFSASNYDDMSRHPIRTDNVLFDAGQVDCYGCHGVTGTAYRQNECLKCHWENRTSGTPTHPNGTFEWATPGTPATQLAAFLSGTIDNNNTLCLQCHGVGGSSASLGNPAQTPTNIFAATAGETVWTAGSGHGQTALKLAKDNLAGPPAYYCADCHKSSAVRTSGQTRDTNPPGVHASINRKLVRNDNALDREYPHPTDNTYTTIDQRSGKMDGFCSTKCHRVPGAPTKDDNVIDHTWNKIGGEVRSPSQTHPTNFLVTTGTYYRQATLLPYSDWLDNATAPMPATGNAVCVTCHNPHGGGDIRDSGGAAVTPIGMKNMLRYSPADNVSTLCKQCHQ